MSGCPFSKYEQDYEGGSDDPIHLKVNHLNNLDASTTWSPSQRISVTGKHEFIPPGPKDLRGPCPGLNAMANHGYMQRNGVTTLLEATDAANKVFGVSTDLSLIMSTMATILAGDPVTTKWSIGGSPPGGLLDHIGGILFGKPSGLSGTHNSYETDASITRGDSYLHGGDQFSLRLEQFEELLALKPPGKDFRSFDAWIAHRKIRMEHSIHNNPYFFFGIFAGVVVGEAGVYFPPELMSNHTPEVPHGVLTEETLYQFFSVSTDAYGKLKYTPGHERIPNNWYRQPTDKMTTLYFLGLIVELILEYPQAGRIGGNTGTVDSFVGIDPSDLTGGIFNSVDLLDPGNLACFSFQLVESVLPGILKPLFKDSGIAALSLVRKAFGPLLSGLNCPLLTLNKSLLEQFPGAGKGPFLRI